MVIAANKKTQKLSSDKLLRLSDKFVFYTVCFWCRVSQAQAIAAKVEEKFRIQESELLSWET
ncbi:hypothetical protein [Nostoc sp.]|uniref:hypothetical protein n=1 Tax=Nostoc sp. TaxID=1180 RepID=UPI002FF69041